MLTSVNGYLQLTIKTYDNLGLVGYHRTPNLATVVQKNMARANTPAEINALTLIQPDDWHIHLRDGAALATTVPHAASQFHRVICMPNLVPPVKTTAEALAYRERIMAHVPTGVSFDPLMVLYLTDNTRADEIATAYNSGQVKAVKLYPAGATTNSADGVTNIKNCYAVLDEMEKVGMPLLVHGEVTHNDIDIFDREKRFIDDVMSLLVENFPKLKVVFEHITTADAADFVIAQPANVAATITPQHLLYNRNHLLVGGVKPHFYCLPILKRQNHQKVLLEVATSGNPKFFLGTDSAPHARHAKEAACGCAGCYSAPMALSLYASAFESVQKLDKLEGFASRFGPQFYGLPINTNTITLVKQPFAVPASYPYLDGKDIVPLSAGQTLAWQVKNTGN